MSGGGQRVARKAVSAEAWQTAPARAGPVAVPSPTEPPTAASLHAGPIAGPGGAGRATETPRVPDALQPVHRKRFSNAARPADLDSTRTLNASTDSLASPTSPVGLWKAPLGKLDYSNPGLGAAHSAPDLPSASAPAPSAQPNIDRPPALPGRPLVKKAAMTEAPIPAPVSFPSQPTQRPPIPQIPHSASSSTFNSFAGRTAPLSGPVPSPSMSSLASHAPSAARIPTQPAALESDKRERLELQRQLKLTQEAKAALEKTTRELREQLAKKSEEWLEKTAKTTKELETAGKLVDESNARLRKAGLAPGRSSFQIKSRPFADTLITLSRPRSNPATDPAFANPGPRFPPSPGEKAGDTTGAFLVATIAV